MDRQEEEFFNQVCQSEKKFVLHYKFTELEEGIGDFRKCTKCNGASIRHHNGKDNKCTRDEVDDDEEIDIEEVMRKKDEFIRIEESTRRKLLDDMIKKTCEDCSFIAETIKALKEHKISHRKSKEENMLEAILKAQEEERKIREEERKERENDRKEREAERNRLKEKEQKDFEERKKLILAISEKNVVNTSKNVEIPKYNGEESLSSYMTKVREWDKIANKAPQAKALDLLASFQEKYPDIYKRLNLELCENKTIPMEDKDVIEKSLVLIQKWFGKTDLEATYEAWTAFNEIKSEKDEKAIEYVRRFEASETKLKSLKVNIPGKILAIHLLKGSGLSASEKRNILTKTDTKDDNKIYDSIKEAMREMKSCLVEDKSTESTAFYGENQRYSRRDSYERSNSRSFDRRGSNDWRNRKSSERRSGSWQRNRSQNSKGENKNENNTRDFKSPGRRRFRFDSKGREYKSPERIYKVDIEKCDINVKDIFTNEDVGMGFTDFKHPDMVVVDNGCPEAVVGKPWLEKYEDALKAAKSADLKFKDCEERFKFGPSQVYTAKKRVEIPAIVGSTKVKIQAYLLDCDVPLLLSKKVLKEWGVSQNYKDSTLIMKNGEIVDLTELKSGHLGLRIGFNEESKEIEECFYGTKANPDKVSIKNVKKIHRILGHPSKEKLIELYENKGNLKKKTKKIIEKMVDHCNICNKYSKRSSRPKVGLPKATTVNETISLDLKEVKTITNDPQDKRYILYHTDEFSKQIKGKVIKNKEAQTVVDGIMTIAMNNLGFPSRTFHSDRGKEFNNKDLQSLCSRNRIKLTMTPSLSPWCNGGNERRHSVIDHTIKKLINDKPDLTIEKALDIALWARNNEIGQLGVSPQQIVSGTGSSIPGIMEGDVVSDSLVTESESVRRHTDNMLLGRKIFREANANMVIKKALRNRVPSYNDVIFERGDKVYFRDENGKPQGPARVRFMDGRNVSISWMGNDRNVNIKDVRPYYEENEDEEENDSDDDEEEDDSDEEKEENDFDVKKETNIDEESKDNNQDVIKEEKRKKNNEIRPNRRENVKYKLYSENSTRKGYVKAVGKSSGKDKHTAWIENKDGNVSVVDFSEQVEWWDYSPKVKFNIDEHGAVKDKTEQNLNPSEILKSYYTDLLLDTKGAEKLGQSKEDSINDEDTKINHLKDEVTEVLAVIVPTSRHNEPEVIDAKKVELENWKKFKAYDIVDDIGQERINTTWVINQKEAHDGLKVTMKARLCLRGFQEKQIPRADSPTASREHLKVALAIGANEGWRGESLDVMAAFLQGSKLDRDVFVTPPDEERVDGELWKLNRAAYGLYDGARQWYLEVITELEALGMQQVTGDEAMYFFHSDGKLEGISILHVDDFLVLGSKSFFSKVVDKLKMKYVFSRITKDRFKFIGLDIDIKENEIILSQEDYTQSIEEIPVDSHDDNERDLEKDEFKSFRGALGQFIFLNEQSRPDLSFDTLEMSYFNKSAKVKHVKEMNKIIRKAKQRKSYIRFGKIGKDLKILAYSDASYLTIEDKTKSVLGKIIFLSDKEEKYVSALEWKSKTITRVCHSVKEAETRALDTVSHDAVALAGVFHEIYTGKRGPGQLKVDIKTDSQSSIDSLNSTKQPEAKNIRPTVRCLKEMTLAGELNSVVHVQSKDCHADFLTKKDANTYLRIMDILHTGKNI